jgi:hypothetical protein
MADSEFLSRDERAALARAALVEELTVLRSRLPKCLGWAKMCGRDDVRYKLKVADEWLAEALDDAGLPRVEIVNPRGDDEDETQPIETTFDTQVLE